MRALLLAALFAAAAPAFAADDDVIWVEYQPDHFIVHAPKYRLSFDLAKPSVDGLYVDDGDGERNILRDAFFYLHTWEGEYQSNFARRPAQAHTVWAGGHLTQIVVQNVVLTTKDGLEWAGLGEITLHCHRDRVYVRASFLTNSKPVIANDLVVYEAAEGHRHWRPQEIGMPLVFLHMTGTRVKGWFGDLKPRDMRLPRFRDDIREVEEFLGHFSVTDDQGTGLSICFPGPDSPYRDVTQVGGVTIVQMWRRDSPPVRGPTTWQPGERHEFSFELVPTTAERVVPDTEAALRNDLEPLPADRFTVTRGEFVGYDATRGTYRFNAQDAHSPTPVKGYYGGCRFTVRNDDRPRTLLIEQFNNWGGLRGAVIRDGEGNPLPIQPQISVNFPERAAEGEHDWGYVIYPLELKPNETRTIWADHLYYGYGQHDQICLFSLENVGGHPLLQTSVAVMESHTVTTGSPELRFNDFRRYKNDYVGYRSVSAVLPSFFRYLDPEGNWHRVIAGPISVQHVGPNLAEYTMQGSTDDGKVDLALHVWQAAHDDMTRVFYRAYISVNEDIEIKPGSLGNLRLLNHHTFNPMYYRKYAFLGADGKVHTGELDVSGTAKEDGTPLPASGAWVAEYYAPNILDYGSMSPEGAFTRMPKDAPGGKWHVVGDIVGNPAFLLRNFRARINGQEVSRPALYVFAARGGDNPDPKEKYARDLAIVLPDLPARVKAGSIITYEAMSFVYGTLDSGYEPAAAEFERWIAAPRSDFPVRVKAENGVAEWTITGGANWMPVLIEGFKEPPVLTLRYRVRGSDRWQTADLGREGNDWYTVYRDGAAYGAVVLVPTHKWPGATCRVESAK